MKLKVLKNWEEIPKDIQAKIEQAQIDDIIERYANSSYFNEDIVHNVLMENGYKLQD